MAKRKTKQTKAARSGYAADIMPERVESEEASGLALPRRTGDGFSSRRHGKMLPSQRKYVAGTHKIVSAQEAEANMDKRMRGELDPIHGGSDDPVARGEDDSTTFEDDLPPEVAKDLRVVSVESLDGEDFDPLGNINPEPGDPELLAEEQALSEKKAVIIPGIGAVNNGIVTDMPEAETVTHSPDSGTLFVQTQPGPTLTEQFLMQRDRVTLELADGCMQMTVIATLPSRYGVTILLPLSAEGVTFIPKPGSEIRITKADKSWECYFLGITFELPELNILGLVFVRNTEDME
jgi:hypothetical protein